MGPVAARQQLLLLGLRRYAPYASEINVGRVGLRILARENSVETDFLGRSGIDVDVGPLYANAQVDIGESELLGVGKPIIFLVILDIGTIVEDAVVMIVMFYLSDVVATAVLGRTGRDYLYATGRRRQLRSRADNESRGVACRQVKHGRIEVDAVLHVAPVGALSAEVEVDTFNKRTGHRTDGVAAPAQVVGNGRLTVPVGDIEVELTGLPVVGGTVAAPVVGQVGHLVVVVLVVATFLVGRVVVVGIALVNSIIVRRQEDAVAVCARHAVTRNVGHGVLRPRTLPDQLVPLLVAGHAPESAQELVGDVSGVVGRDVGTQVTVVLSLVIVVLITCLREHILRGGLAPAVEVAVILDAPCTHVHIGPLGMAGQSEVDHHDTEVLDVAIVILAVYLGKRTVVVHTVVVDGRDGGREQTIHLAVGGLGIGDHPGSPTVVTGLEVVGGSAHHETVSGTVTIVESQDTAVDAGTGDTGHP